MFQVSCPTYARLHHPNIRSFSGMVLVPPALSCLALLHSLQKTIEEAECHTARLQRELETLRGLEAKGQLEAHKVRKELEMLMVDNR